MNPNILRLLAALIAAATAVFAIAAANPASARQDDARAASLVPFTAVLGGAGTKPGPYQVQLRVAPPAHDNFSGSWGIGMGIKEGGVSRQGSGAAPE
jgi:hypothetical protein